MLFTDDFRLAMSVEDAWTLLGDLGQVARWIPGAEVESTEDGSHRGKVPVRVGPIVATFEGSAEVTRVEEELHQAVITATGAEVTDADHAPSVVVLTVTVRPLRDGCQVDVHARADVKGRVARFGAGVLQDVSARALRDFAERLRKDLKLGAPPRPLPEGLPPIEVRHPYVLEDDAPARSTARVRVRTANIPEPDPDAPPRPEDRFDLDPPPGITEPEPEPVVPEPEPAPVVPEPDPAPVVPEPDPAPVVPEPEPAPVVPEPEPAPVVPEPEPAPVVPDPPAEPQPVVVPEPAPAAVANRAPVVPPLVQHGRTSADVLRGPDPAVTGTTVAPIAIIVVLLWILRRLLGSSGE
jgi:carbon monoxide dehydrogenase subunit G